MTEPPTGSPWDPEQDDRRVRAQHAAPSHATPSHAAPPHTAASHRHEPEPPFEGPLHALSRAAWQIVLLTGAASLVLGVLVLVWPGASLFAAGVLFGVYLVVSGAFQLVAAFG
ncbi:DUF308 domain-containing protein, partial [Streptomyces bobili]